MAWLILNQKQISLNLKLLCHGILRWFVWAALPSVIVYSVLTTNLNLNVCSQLVSSFISNTSRACVETE